MTEMVPDSMNSGALRTPTHTHRLRPVRTAVHMHPNNTKAGSSSIETAGRNVNAENGMGEGERVGGLTGEGRASRRPWRTSPEPRQASTGSGRPVVAGSRRRSRSAGGAGRSTGQPRLHTAAAGSPRQLGSGTVVDPFRLVCRSRQESEREGRGSLGRRRARVSRGGG